MKLLLISVLALTPTSVAFAQTASELFADPLPALQNTQASPEPPRPPPVAGPAVNETTVRLTLPLMNWEFGYVPCVSILGASVGEQWVSGWTLEGGARVSYFGGADDFDEQAPIDVYVRGGHAILRTASNSGIAETTARVDLLVGLHTLTHRVRNELELDEPIDQLLGTAEIALAPAATTWTAGDVGLELRLVVAASAPLVLSSQGGTVPWRPIFSFGLTLGLAFR